MLIACLNRGGAQRHVRGLLAARPDHLEFALVDAGEGRLAGDAACLSVTFYSLKLTGIHQPLCDFQAYRRLLSLLDTLRPDLVHVALGGGEISSGQNGPFLNQL